ncbi:transcription factor Adf-1-like isoform X2 [Centruroides vittatus]|uniref:transcription factor Adf-1-like isoform X2 n=1 Tax=Centruroides vittatus TaxID=120091 RepID=UPI00350FFD0E
MADSSTPYIVKNRKREDINMAFDTEAFIRMIESYPFLYDKSRKEFKDVSFKHTYWTAIGAAFNVSAEECIKKWKNLKDRYMKLKNNIDKSKRSGAATSEIYKTNWKYFDILNNMLRGGLRNEHLNTCTNIPDMPQSESEFVNSDFECEDTTNQLPEFLTQNSMPELTGASTSTSVSPQPFVHSPFQSSQRKRKRNEEDDDLADIIKETSGGIKKYLEESHNSRDEVFYFINNIGLRLRKFERKKMLLVMHKIENLIFEEEMESLQ